MESRRIDKATILSDPDKGLKSRVKHEHKVLARTNPEKYESNRAKVMQAILANKNPIFGKITYNDTVVHIESIAS